MMTTSIEEKYLFTTETEAIKKKDWAAGTREQVASNELIIDKNLTATWQLVTYSPAWLKIIDEAIVNAIDHYVRTMGKRDAVSKIEVSLDYRGRVTVKNNGKGIEVQIHKVASEKMNKEMWVPEFVFGVTHQGSNVNKSEDSLTGGVNGLGIKITNSFSKEFKVETVDREANLHYSQVWHGRDVVDKPTIRKSKEKSFTQVSFLPDYAEFGFKDGVVPDDALEQMKNIIRTRMAMAASYVSYFNNERIKVIFNREFLDIKGTKKLTQILCPGAQAVYTTLGKELPWDVAIVITDSAPDVGISNVNGIVVKSGSHFNHLIKELAEALTAIVRKDFKKSGEIVITPNIVKSNIFIVANCKIKDPKWTGQRKDTLQIKSSNTLKQYQFDQSTLSKIALLLKDKLKRALMGVSQKSTPSNSPIDSSKYEPAEFAKRGKNREQCVLLLAEGDSAMTLINSGIGANKELSKQFIGIMSLSGVIMNVRNKSVVNEDEEGRKKITQTDQLAKNKFVQMLLNAVGLVKEAKYDPESETYETEMSKLRYSCIVGCVDQDLDGVGNIFSLILSLFQNWWPNLFKSGFIRRLETPVIRAYPKTRKNGSTAKEFYTDFKYIEWSKTVEISEWEIRYYKGLSSHDETEAKQMFKKFTNKLCTYALDEGSATMFEVYHGSDPSKRKAVLAGPAIAQDIESLLEEDRTKIVKCTNHLTYQTRSFQKDAIERHLDSAIDGMNQGGRMIYHGSYTHFRSTNNKRIKVAQLAGVISKTENYHHGESVLEDSITGKAFLAVGGKQLPQLIPLAQFGSRLEGGADAGASRYIYTKFNERLMNTIYPPVDYPMLEFIISEGKRTSPRVFMPIIPMSIVESSELPGYGWKMKIWGRDALEIIENVKSLIKCRNKDDYASVVWPMKPCLDNWKGTIVHNLGVPYALGDYERVGTKIEITELPIRVWTKPYIAKLEKIMKDRGHIATIFNNSTDKTVHIHVELTSEAALAEIMENYGNEICDPFIDYFKLKVKMTDNINLIGYHSEVKEFKSYEEVVIYWFDKRKDLYGDRLDRMLESRRIKLILINQTIKYIAENNRMKGLSITEMEELLREKGYPRINKSRALDPKFIPTADLQKTIIDGPKSTYDYLLNITDRQRSNEAIEKLEREVKEISDEITMINLRSHNDWFKGAYMWLEELAELTTIIIEGKKTNWLFNDYNIYKYE